VSFTLYAPSGGITVLPNPEFDNSEALTAQLTHRRSMTGVHYTYVRNPGEQRRRFSYEFRDVGHEKLVEVQEFFKLFGGQVITVIDQDDVSRQLIFADSDVGIVIEKRGFPSGTTGALHDVGTLTLDFVPAPSV